ncbi:hypothetical protein KEM56_003767 [Ascosphaera pollenicola]|nr:hypothetical protein KEM56_003767 [Ascosphaera pollenicola]
MARIFITGGSGFIGSAVIDKAIAEGYQVYALSRTSASDSKLSARGAVPVRGDLTSYDVLRDQSAQADIVLHLAHGFMGDYNEIIRIDHAAVDAMAAGLEWSNKPLVSTSGTLIVEATGGLTTEESALAKQPINDRIKCERHTLALSSKGIRVSVIRLAPFVYGRGASGVRLFMDQFSQAGVVTCVNDGDNRTTTVHVDDAASLYLLAAEKAKAGDVFNGSCDNFVTLREMLEAIGSVLNIPLEFVSLDDATDKLGRFFAYFLSAENQATGAKARSQLSWEPRGADIIADIKTGSYLAVAEELKKKKSVA